VNISKSCVTSAGVILLPYHQTKTIQKLFVYESPGGMSVKGRSHWYLAIEHVRPLWMHIMHMNCTFILKIMLAILDLKKIMDVLTVNCVL